MILGEDNNERLVRMEDLEAIRTLKHRYCELCDSGFDPHALAALFTENGVWDAGEAYGRYVGRAAIETFFSSMGSHVSFSMHCVTNNIIDIDGNTARGRWKAIVPSSMRAVGKSIAQWTFTGYEDRYRKVQGKWYFDEVKSIIGRASEHVGGWE